MKNFKSAKSIEGLMDIIDQYDVYILDQWGVMHNGVKGYDHAIKCVKKLYKKKNDLIIISNSSKRKKTSVKRLSKLGFDPDCFVEVMTSGEMIWQSLKNKNCDFTKNIKKNCYHIYDKSKKDGKYYIKGLDKFNFVNKIEEADFILGCTPTLGSNTIDYIPLLTKALEKKLPFVCANPDYESVESNSNKPIICMGTIAELYKSLGGEIFVLGKPSLDIYIESTKKIKKLDKSKVLVVGDSIYHDIKGAKLFGVDSLLITSGIHQSSFDNIKPEWNSNTNQVKNLDITPTFLCSKFQL